VLIGEGAGRLARGGLWLSEQRRPHYMAPLKQCIYGSRLKMFEEAFDKALFKLAQSTRPGFQQGGFFEEEEITDVVRRIRQTAIDNKVSPQFLRCVAAAGIAFRMVDVQSNRSSPYEHTQITTRELIQKFNTVFLDELTFELEGESDALKNLRTFINDNDQLKDLRELCAPDFCHALIRNLNEKGLLSNPAIDNAFQHALEQVFDGDTNSIIKAYEILLTLAWNNDKSLGDIQLGFVMNIDIVRSDQRSKHFDALEKLAESDRYKEILDIFHQDVDESHLKIISTAQETDFVETFMVHLRQDLRPSDALQQDNSPNLANDASTDYTQLKHEFERLKVDNTELVTEHSEMAQELESTKQKYVQKLEERDQQQREKTRQINELNNMIQGLQKQVKEADEAKSVLIRSAGASPNNQHEYILNSLPPTPIENAGESPTLAGESPTREDLESHIRDLQAQVREKTQELDEADEKNNVVTNRFKSLYRSTKEMANELYDENIDLAQQIDFYKAKEAVETQTQETQTPKPKPKPKLEKLVRVTLTLTQRLRESLRKSLGRARQQLSSAKDELYEKKQIIDALQRELQNITDSIVHDLTAASIVDDHTPASNDFIKTLLNELIISNEALETISDEYSRAVNLLEEQKDNNLRAQKEALLNQRLYAMLEDLVTHLEKKIELLESQIQDLTNESSPGPGSPVLPPPTRPPPEAPSGAPRRSGPDPGGPGGKSFLILPSAEDQALQLVRDVFSPYLERGADPSQLNCHKFFVQLEHYGTRIFIAPEYRPDSNDTKEQVNQLSKYVNNPYASPQGKAIFEHFAELFTPHKGWEFVVYSNSGFSNWASKVFYPTLKAKTRVASG
jgi:hypothetical protein